MPDYIYNAANYTLQEVNEGQRKINYALTVADERLVDVLVAIADALKDPSGHVRNHVPAIEAAIKEASKTIKQVASIRPPGCDETWKPEPEPDPNPTPS